MIGIIRDETFLERGGYIIFEHKKEVFEELKVEPDDEKLRRYSQTGYHV